MVLPVSLLKPRASEVFDALEAGRVVYVSNRGEVEAAFIPSEAIPKGIAAAYTSPGAVHFSELTARDLGRFGASRAVDEATAGLPSLMTKNGRRSCPGPGS